MVFQHCFDIRFTQMVLKFAQDLQFQKCLSHFNAVFGNFGRILVPNLYYLFFATVDYSGSLRRSRYQDLNLAVQRTCGNAAASLSTFSIVVFLTRSSFFIHFCRRSFLMAHGHSKSIKQMRENVFQTAVIVVEQSTV